MAIKAALGLFGLITVGAVALVVVGARNAATLDEQGQSRLPAAPVVPEGDAEAGAALFVSEGCVICHAVRGVGGRLAPALDAEAGDRAADPLDFAAAMWRGAPVMVELQRLELGYRIDLDGEQLADLAAFAGDPAVQDQFDLSDVPTETRDLFLNQPVTETDLLDRYQGEDFSGDPLIEEEMEAAEQLQGIE